MKGCVLRGEIIVLALVAGCGGKPPADAGGKPRAAALLPGPSVPVRMAAEAPAPSATEGFPVSTLRDALCAGRSPCRLTARRDAGRDPRGASLVVAELALHDRKGDWKAPDLEHCAPYEEWLLVERGDRVLSTQKLLQLCNDGHGAGGGGEDHVTVSPGKVFHQQSGGSAWRWTTNIVADLAPLRITRESFEEYRMSGGSDGWEWSWESLSGRATWELLPCSEDGTEWNELEGGEPRSFEAAVIPRVALSPAMLRSGWRNARLGSCSATVKSDGTAGYVVHGAPGLARDARMSVVAVGARTLIIEVHDDRFVSGATRWIYDDHLEVWAGSSAECFGPGAGTPRQWAVMADDGEVIAGFGKPAPFDVERVAGGAGQDAWVRFKITLRDDLERLTVVYSDSDDGASQERLIATSRFAFKRGETIGVVRRLPAAGCAVEGDALEMRYAKRFTRDEPALQASMTE